MGFPALSNIKLQLFKGYYAHHLCSMYTIYSIKLLLLIKLDVDESLSCPQISNFAMGEFPS